MKNIKNYFEGLFDVDSEKDYKLFHIGDKVLDGGKLINADECLHIEPWSGVAIRLNRRGLEDLISMCKQFNTKKVVIEEPSNKWTRNTSEKQYGLIIEVNRDMDFKNIEIYGCNKNICIACNSSSSAKLKNLSISPCPKELGVPISFKLKPFNITLCGETKCFDVNLECNIIEIESNQFPSDPGLKIEAEEYLLYSFKKEPNQRFDELKKFGQYDELKDEFNIDTKTLINPYGEVGLYNQNWTKIPLEKFK